MYCPKCGKEVMEGSNYCPSCGNQVVSTQPETPLPPKMGQQVAPTAPAAPGEQQQGWGESHQSTGGTNVPPPEGIPPNISPPPIPPPPGAGGSRVPPPPGVPVQNVVKNNPMCIASLALGIASLVFIFGPVFGTLLGIAGIVLGKMGMDQVDERPDLYIGKNMGQIGFVLSIAGAALNILFTIARFTFWSTRIFW